jgi:hypothetical protein
MSVERSVFTTRTFECAACGQKRRHLSWDYDPAPVCCGTEMAPEVVRIDRSSSVLGDEIDIVIPHGMCHDDGSPKRWRSRSELRAAEKAKGWVRVGDTPNSTPNRWV